MSLVADGPETRTIGRPSACARLERRDQLRHGLDDRFGANHADVQVGDEAESSPALPGAAVEGDRARLGARRGTGRDGAVESVEIAGAEIVVLDEFDAGRPELTVEIHGDPDAARGRGQREPRPRRRPGRR